jgi:hypothetical protein
MASYRVPMLRSGRRSVTRWARKKSMACSENGGSGFRCRYDRKSGPPVTTGVYPSGRGK